MNSLSIDTEWRCFFDEIPAWTPDRTNGAVDTIYRRARLVLARCFARKSREHSPSNTDENKRYAHKKWVAAVCHIAACWKKGRIRQNTAHHTSMRQQRGEDESNKPPKDILTGTYINLEVCTARMCHVWQAGNSTNGRATDGTALGHPLERLFIVIDRLMHPKWTWRMNWRACHSQVHERCGCWCSMYFCWWWCMAAQEIMPRRQDWGSHPHRTCEHV